MLSRLELHERLLDLLQVASLEVSGGGLVDATLILVVFLHQLDGLLYLVERQRAEGVLVGCPALDCFTEHRLEESGLIGPASRFHAKTLDGDMVERASQGLSNRLGNGLVDLVGPDAVSFRDDLGSWHDDFLWLVQLRTSW